jgi:hypothetical protein
MDKTKSTPRLRQHPSIIKRLKNDKLELKIPEHQHTTTLNFSANAVWELCDGQQSIHDIADMLAKRFGVAVDDISSEVGECIAELLNLGLLILSKPDNNPGHHPDTNIDEGHLGGYIRGRQSAVPTVFEFEHGDPSTWIPDLWSWAYQALGVRSMIDIGCGEGHAARYFRDLGCEVLGIDGSQQAKRDSLIADQHVTHDFTHGPYHPSTAFDLVWSCEFVEHVEERYLNNFLETFACSQRYLMMTFASPGQPGYHHVNCQHKDYWIDKIESMGFRFNPVLTDTSRAISSEGHYKSRGLFFTRS